MKLNEALLKNSISLYQKIIMENVIIQGDNIGKFYTDKSKINYPPGKNFIMGFDSPDNAIRYEIVFDSEEFCFYIFDKYKRAVTRCAKRLVDVIRSLSELIYTYIPEVDDSSEVRQFSNQASRRANRAIDDRYASMVADSPFISRPDSGQSARERLRDVDYYTVDEFRNMIYATFGPPTGGRPSRTNYKPADASWVSRITSHTTVVSASTLRGYLRGSQRLERNGRVPRLLLSALEKIKKENVESFGNDNPFNDSSSDAGSVEFDL